MPSSKQKTTAKKPVKKAPAKAKRAPAATSASTRVTRVARPTSHQYRSFRASRPADSFFTFRITHQTLYWLILALIVLALGLWVVDLNNKVQKIYDQIDATNQQLSESAPTPVKKQ